MIGSIRTLASLKLTLAGMVLLGAGALVYYRGDGTSLLWLAIPLSALALNLIAALAVSPRFRSQPPLFAFHVCLLLMVTLAAASLLTRFDGRLEISEGQWLAGSQIEVLERGPLHVWGLPDGRFEQGAIRVDYAPGVVRERTRSVVRLRAGDGSLRAEQIGDDSPLILDGYRFYTTSNKGWAVLLTWQESNGEALHGVVHLPSYPFLVRKQRNHWQLPTGERATLHLELEDVAIDEAWVLNSEPRAATLVVELRGRKQRLSRGESLSLDQGELRFEGLRLWMGYRVSFNPILPWLAASALGAVFFMSWHFWVTLWSDHSPLASNANSPLEV